MNKKMLGLALALVSLVLIGCATNGPAPSPIMPEIDPPKGGEVEELKKPDPVKLDARLLQECPIPSSTLDKNATALEALSARREDLVRAVDCALNHNALIRVLKEKLGVIEAK